MAFFSQRLKKYIFLILLFVSAISLFSQTRTIHVFVALCDNVNQGIVPVPESIGNGQNPRTNLYWGCGYGVSTYFKNSTDWKLLQTIKNPTPGILERLLFKHAVYDVYLLADAYDGSEIKQTNIDLLKSASGNFTVTVSCDSAMLHFGGESDLVAYIGHNGLMDFFIENNFEDKNSKKKDAIVLGCISNEFYLEYLKSAGAFPLLMTSNYMAPEAYTLEWALDGWVLKETGEQIKERAAQAYNHYQKCGINGARKLFSTGW